MSYIILIRNPSNRMLFAIQPDGDDDQSVMEFDTYDAATKVADETTGCKAWGYQILEVD